MPDFTARPFCPECEPERSVIDEVLDVCYCSLHQPSYAGLDDARVETRYLAGGSSEANGETCRLYADLIHRRRTLLRGAS